jgi:hypothetical protein
LLQPVYDALHPAVVTLIDQVFDSSSTSLPILSPPPSGMKTLSALKLRFFASCPMFADICILKLLEQFLGPVGDRLGQSCQLGNLDAITAVCTSTDNFSEEYDIVALFLYSYAVILDPRQLAFKLRQFV